MKKWCILLLFITQISFALVQNTTGPEGGGAGGPRDNLYAGGEIEQQKLVILFDDFSFPEEIPIDEIDSILLKDGEIIGQDELSQAEELIISVNEIDSVHFVDESQMEF